METRRQLVVGSNPRELLVGPDRQHGRVLTFQGVKDIAHHYGLAHAGSVEQHGDALLVRSATDPGDNVADNLAGHVSSGPADRGLVQAQQRPA